MSSQLPMNPPMPPVRPVDDDWSDLGAPMAAQPVQAAPVAELEDWRDLGASSAPVASPSVPQPSPTPPQAPSLLSHVGQTISDSVGRGVDQMQGMAYGAVEATGEALGAPSVTDWGREGRERNEQETAAYGDTQNFTGIRSVGDAGQWALETAASQAPQIGLSVAGAAGGAALGALTGPAAPVMVPLGAAVGAFVPGFVLGVGEVQGSIKEKDPNAVAPGYAFAGGSAIAALDSILPGKIGSRLVRSMGLDVAEEVAKKAFLKEVAKDAGQEAVTEALQEAIGEHAAAWGTNTDVDYQELGWNMVEAGAAGALVGGGTSAVTAPFTRQKQAVDSNGLPQGAAPAETIIGADPEEIDPNALQGNGLSAAQGSKEITPSPLTGLEGLNAVRMELTPEIQSSQRKMELQELLDDPRPLEEIKAAREAQQQQAQQAQDQARVDQLVSESAAQATEQVRDSVVQQLGGKVTPDNAPDYVRLLEEGMQALGTKASPINLDVNPELVNHNAHQTSTPTPGQAEAGNYGKRRFKWQGFDISIETEQGAERTGIDRGGNAWSVTMPAPYGYLRGTKGADGDHLDVYIGTNPQAPTVYVIDQVDADSGAFDETKSIIGASSPEEAQQIYLAGFSDGRGPERMGALTPMSVQQFKQWARNGNHKKPVAYKPQNASTRADASNGGSGGSRDGASTGQHSVQALGSDEGALPQFTTQGLRGQPSQGYHGPSGLGGQFPGIPGRRGGSPEPSAQADTDRGAQGLRSGQRTMGDGSENASNSQHLEQDQEALLRSERSGLSDVRRAGDNNASTVGRELSDVRGRNGGEADVGSFSRPDRQQQGLRAGQRSVGDQARTGHQSPIDSSPADPSGADADRDRVGRGDGSAPIHPVRQGSEWVDGRESSDRANSQGDKRNSSGNAQRRNTDRQGMGSAGGRPEAGDLQEAKGGASPNLRKASKRQPRNLLEHLAQIGGIAPDEAQKAHRGELRARDVHNHFIPGWGRLVRKGGVDLDKAREHAVELGYLPHSASVDDLLSLIEQEARYKNKAKNAAETRDGWAMLEGEQDPAEREFQARAVISDALVEVGLSDNEISPTALEMAAEIVLAGEARGFDTYLDAYEQAVRLLGEGRPAIAEDAETADIPFFGGSDEQTPDTRAGQDLRQDHPQTREPGDRDGEGRVDEAGDGSTENRGVPGEAGSGPARPDEEVRREVTPEAGADGKPQTVIPGAERISQTEQAQRKADEGLKASAPQKDTEGLALFGDARNQVDLFDEPRRTESSTASPLDLRDELAPSSRRDADENSIEDLQSEPEYSSAPARPRRHGIPAAVNQPIADFRNDQPLKNHPSYKAAKAGDSKAAVHLVTDLVKPTSIQEAERRFGRDVVYVPIIASERSGKNAIPATLAAYYAQSTGARDTADIQQANEAFHTGAGAMERVTVRATFTGPVEKGARYVLVDDVSVMGSTLADMADHIQRNGGEVAGVVLLANAGRNEILAPDRATIRKVQKRFGDAIEGIFGLDPQSLTTNEARYLLNFPDADALRTRRLAADRARTTRLRSKGVPASAPERAEDVGAPSTQDAAEAGATAEGAETRLTEQEISDVREIVDRVAGEVTVETPDSIPMRGPGAKAWGADTGDAAGVYLRGRKPVESVIKVVATLWGDFANRTAYHESFHHLQAFFLTAQERKVLEKAEAALRRIVANDPLRADQVDLMSAKEVEAESFAIYATTPNARGFPANVRNVFARILRMLRRVWSYLNGRGYQTWEDIFDQAASGEIARRDNASAPDADAEYQLRPSAPPAPRHERQDLIRRGQFVERALRLPFDVFGGVDREGRWNPSTRLHDRAKHVITEAKIDPNGTFGFLHSTVENVRRGLIDRYGLDEAYVKRDRQSALDKQGLLAEGQAIMEHLADNQVGAAEAKVLQAILTGEAVDNDALNRLAAPIRQSIDQLGEEAVQLGLISRESFERNRGSYLHRVYMKDQQEVNHLVKFVGKIMERRRKRILGDQMKGRGIFLEVTAQRLTAADPEWAKARRGRPFKGEKFHVLDYVPGTSIDLLSGDQQAKATRRIYWPADRPIPAKYQGQGWTDKGVFEVREDKNLQKMTLWRDYSKSERERMGEILDARYTIAKTYALLANDLATGRFFKDVAENDAWTSSIEPGGRSVEASEFNRYWNDPAIEWVKVPETTIADTGGKKKWGALAGKWVRAEIWKDLNETDIMNRPGTWRTLLTQWKLNKTARNPVVHMNNVMSNFMFMDLADVRAQDFIAGLQSYISEDEHYQDAARHGAFGTDQISQEMREKVLKPLLDELRDNQAGGVNPVLARFGLVGKIADFIWTGIKGLDERMIDLYQLEDEVFRMALYRRRLALGDSPERAADLARQQFIDYDIKAPWINAMRNTVLPFLSYSYRAVPLVAQAIAERPWKLAKYFAVFYVINALAYAWDDDDDEEKERATMRKDEQGKTWTGMPRMLRMPWSDANGLPVFLDVRRWVPAGDVFDAAQGQSALSIPAWLNAGGPILLGAEFVLNKQAFTGKPITNDLTDSGLEKAGKVGVWAWKSWMPNAPWMPFSYSWDKIDNARKGAEDSATGEAYSLREALLSTVGIKAKPLDVERAARFRMLDFQRERRALEDELKNAQRQKQRRILSETEFEKTRTQIRAKIERVNKAQKEFQEITKR